MKYSSFILPIKQHQKDQKNNEKKSNKINKRVEQLANCNDEIGKLGLSFIKAGARDRTRTRWKIFTLSTPQVPSAIASSNYVNTLL